MARRYKGRPDTLRTDLVLSAVETERNHHWGTVWNAINAFEPSTARKTDTIRAEARKSNSTARQR